MRVYVFFILLGYGLLKCQRNPYKNLNGQKHFYGENVCTEVNIGRREQWPRFPKYDLGYLNFWAPNLRYSTF